MLGRAGHHPPGVRCSFLGGPDDGLAAEAWAALRHAETEDPLVSAVAARVAIHRATSQLRSIYRKLGSSTRTQTITRARELGLPEGCGLLTGFPLSVGWQLLLHGVNWDLDGIGGT